MVKNPYLPMQETWVRFLGHEDPLENRMATHSSGQRSLEGYSSWGRKKSDMTEQLNNDNKNKCL